MRIGVLTVSDACAAGEREDRSGGLLEAWVREEGHELVCRATVADEALDITRTLVGWCDDAGVDVIFTTGGTGFAPRDVTPEATRPVLDRDAPGVAERIRRHGEASTPFSVLSRGLVGCRGRTLIANLPGSPGGVKDGLTVLGPMVRHVGALLADAPTDHTPPAREDVG